MANTPVTSFFEQVDGLKNLEEQLDRKATRLTGDLAVGTEIDASGSANEKVKIKGAYRVRVLAKFSGDGTGLLTITPILADGTTKAGSNAVASDGTGAAGTEIALDFECYGESFLDIDLTEDGTSDAITVTYVDVFIL
jgi:hypothetical protein